MYIIKTMSGGTSNERGIFYQELVFDGMVLEHEGTDVVYQYECVDDAYEEDSLFCGNAKATTFQVKSGTITKDILISVFANWMSRDFSLVNDFVLFSENACSDIQKQDDFLPSLIEKIKAGKGCRSDSKFFKAYTYCLHKGGEIDETITSLFSKVASHLTYSPLSVDEAKKKIKKQYDEKYNYEHYPDCTLEKRVEKFENDLHGQIREAIFNKNLFEIRYSAFIKLIVEANQAFTASVYSKDWFIFKKQHEQDQSSVETVESDQAYFKKLSALFNENQTELYAYVLRKLFYDDLKSYFSVSGYDDSIKLLDNAENQAIENFDRLKGQISVTGSHVTPIEFFYKLINEKIDCKVFSFENLLIYQQGCYVFCSNDDTGKEEIVWNWQN